ncbi:MAG: stage II sporulation protein P [Clostridia bacterium]|nr:stage II sporulation protein P [Clostridia bacterium]
MKKLALLVLCSALLLGCGGKEKMEAMTSLPETTASAEAREKVVPVDTPAPTATPTPSPTPTATPVPTPTPLFVPRDENGNLIINEDLYASFTQTEFPLPSAPVVLIYHTHAEEAYRQTRDYTYEETGENTFKTLDKTKSVAALGELLKAALEERGFTVIHDDTDVEPPEIRSAYSRSLEVMEKYPEATVFIDLHRNTANVKQKKDDVVLVDGKRCARMFFVVGTSVGTYEGEYDTHHDWQQNYALAKAVTERLRKIDPRFAIDIRLKVGRYNQHVSPYCVLIELGHNANTFADAANSVPYLADALAATLVIDKE